MEKIFRMYPFREATQCNGLNVKLGEMGLLEIRFYKEPFSEDQFLITETGAYPLKEVDESYSQGFKDCEQHSYRTDSILDVDAQIYRAKTYRDGEFSSEKCFPMENIFSRNPRIKDEGTLRLFALLNDNMAILRRNVIVETRCSTPAIWKMADGSLVPVTVCPCTGTDEIAQRGWARGAKFYRNQLYYDGKNISRGCYACGAREKLF